LWAIHRRLAIFRRYGALSGQEIRLLGRIEEMLAKDYDSVWAAAMVAAKQREV
jgi:hypothetical protein